MIRAAACLVALALPLTSALAQGAATNAMRDAARAQERQALALERMEVIRRDEARRAAQDRQNAERDSRSLRRFDKR